ncbi:iron ABC transporter permease [Plantactinospora sp. KBS50]|uniref:FecCD family ABC transporter permease n=1 Tax=Plantactinospora sp. KBS50 TaxID=2024580 RepID=UPI000BAB1090|nr:iron ABC transporter permease [Plantactinospora sp. KBS50]ASW52932.1 iron ABC transporter permease [Plantactinospora sp. KBS50]
MKTVTTGPSPDAVTTRRPATVRAGWFAAAVIVLALACAASIAFGARVISPGEIVSAFTGGGDGVAEAAVLQRVPRTLLAVLVGAALGLAGAVMQGVTRNPLADPQILGVTSGAAFFVVVGIAFFGLSSPLTYVWVAIAGCAVSAAFVYTIASMGSGGPTPLKLALAGAVTAAAVSSLVSVILLPRIRVMNEFRFWQIGGVGGATYSRALMILPFLAVGVLICAASARRLNSLALGDDVAAGLGEHVIRTRVVASAGSFILCGAVTAVAGPIGFVGLVVPHICRLLIGIDHRWLLPYSALVGAILLTVADVIGRVVARPSEVDVGIITALVGAPFFIYIARRQKVSAI